MINIGTVYRDEGNWFRARQWFQKAFDAGDNEALLDLAKLAARDKRRRREALRMLDHFIRCSDVAEASREEAILLQDELRLRLSKAPKDEVIRRNQE